MLHILGWGSLVFLVAPQAFALGTDSTGTPLLFGIGVGLSAYALGMRHAFDADHIAAIDNTTRRLLANGRPASTVGFWFSLGHSTIVVILCVLLAFGVRSLGTQLADDSSTLHQWTSVIGPTISGVFLILIALLNVGAVVGIVQTARQRALRGDTPGAVPTPAARGILSRFIVRSNRGVRNPVQMYLVGLLFGLGFDTATEIGLLVLAGAGAASALPWYAILTLPVLFAAGMSTLDTAQGMLMRRAYGWADHHPGRAVAYNVGVTSLSLVVAFGIGAVELASVLVDTLGVDGPIASIGTVDLDWLGFGLAGALLIAWAAVVAIARARRTDGATHAGGPPRAAA